MQTMNERSQSSPAVWCRNLRKHQMLVEHETIAEYVGVSKVSGQDKRNQWRC